MGRLKSASGLGRTPPTASGFQEFAAEREILYATGRGDALEGLLVTLFSQVLRSTDIVCRYGGEEFAVILPDATLSDAAPRAEQLREAVGEAEIEPRMRNLRVNISVGVSAYPEVDPGSKELLRSADSALYAAKKAGRNRVHSAVAAISTRTPSGG
jgi:diguanylate cyclase (GGDEF)-like protein